MKHGYLLFVAERMANIADPFCPNKSLAAGFGEKKNGCLQVSDAYKEYLGEKYTYWVAYDAFWLI